jgi:hypothetical protein
MGMNICAYAYFSLHHTHTHIHIHTHPCLYSSTYLSMLCTLLTHTEPATLHRCSCSHPCCKYIYMCIHTYIRTTYIHTCVCVCVCELLYFTPCVRILSKWIAVTHSHCHIISLLRFAALSCFSPTLTHLWRTSLPLFLFTLHMCVCVCMCVCMCVWMCVCV